MAFLVIYARINEHDDEYRIDGPYFGHRSETEPEAIERAKEIISKTSRSSIPIVEVFDLSKLGLYEAKEIMTGKTERALYNIQISQETMNRTR